jgi:hypothetical protein
MLFVRLFELLPESRSLFGFAAGDMKMEVKDMKKDPTYQVLAYTMIDMVDTGTSPLHSNAAKFNSSISNTMLLNSCVIPRA